MLLKLRNLGFASLAMLDGAGIKTAAQLRELGAVAAYVAVKRSGATPSLNLLWALEGALTDRNWLDVAADDRMALLLQLEDYEKRDDTNAPATHQIK